jgi:hypothetical protein
MRPRLEDVDAAVQRLPVLMADRAGRAIAIVVIGDEPYRAADVEAVLGVAVLAVLPVDARSAAAITAPTPGRRAVHRLPLLRSVRVLAAELALLIDGVEPLIATEA